MTRLIRKALWGWEAWRRRRQMQRVLPVMRELDQRLAQYRKQHKRGSARIVRERRDALHRAMMGA